MASALRLEPSRKLGERGSFARALQADQHDLDRRLDLEVDFAGAPAHHLLQLLRDEANQMLLGGQRAQHFLADRLFPDMLDKVADDLDVDVGFEQRQAHFAQRIVDIALGNPPLPLELFEYAFETIAEGVEHRFKSRKGRWAGSGFSSG